MGCIFQWAQYMRRDGLYFSVGKVHEVRWVVFFSGHGT